MRLRTNVCMNPACGHINLPIARYCARCGSLLGAGLRPIRYPAEVNLGGALALFLVGVVASLMLQNIVPALLAGLGIFVGSVKRRRRRWR